MFLPATVAYNAFFATLIFDAGVTEVTATLSDVTLIEGDELALSTSLIGETVSGRDLTVTVECREYGL